MVKILAFILVVILSGCSAKLPVQGHLGFSDNRRVVIVGETVEATVAEYYQRRYDAPVWFTPSQGKVVDSANRLLEGVGPSKGMRMLIAELKSINYTVGRWEIIVPKIAEKYFAATLRHIEGGGLAKARGMFVLIDSAGNKEIEEQVKRVTADSFFVSYEFQK